MKNENTLDEILKKILMDGRTDRHTGTVVYVEIIYDCDNNLCGIIIITLCDNLYV